MMVTTTSKSSGMAHARRSRRRCTRRKRWHSICGTAIGDYGDKERTSLKMRGTVKLTFKALPYDRLAPQLSCLKTSQPNRPVHHHVTRPCHLPPRHSRYLHSFFTLPSRYSIDYSHRCNDGTEQILLALVTRGKVEERGDKPDRNIREPKEGYHSVGADTSRTRTAAGKLAVPSKITILCKSLHRYGKRASVTF